MVHYWSCDGAIEYIFNTIHSYFLFIYPKMQNISDLEVELENIIENNLGLFRKHFRHWDFVIDFINNGFYTLIMHFKLIHYNFFVAQT